MRFDDDFDKHFKRTQSAAIAGIIFSGLVTLVTLSFVGWVVVKLMAHFGVL